MTKNPLSKRLSDIIEFLKEAEKLKLVERIPYLSDKKRRENDAEHSWYVAMMLLAVEDELGITFDAAKTYKMIVVHDLVEVYTGDDWVPDVAGKALKHQKEMGAADKIFGMLPADLNQKLRVLWEEYDEGKTVEAKIAKALDKISYTLQYAISGRIEWHGQLSTKIEARDYAWPYVKDNSTLIAIFDELLSKVEKTKEHQSH